MSTIDSTPESTPKGSRRLVKTGTPGIYRKRRADGSPGAYVVVFRRGQAA